MELQIALILLIAFIFLGPEKMMELAIKLGDLLRKVRETWDELRYQMYLESINKKVLEEQNEEIQEVKEDGTAGTSQDAPDGTSEGTKKQTD
ncbi:twin-arginine translocase TatA/TatE family subunit [Hydrogenobacter hydrogenophilus]|uniref:Sec-independent protein translocase protein TatB n=1 Tax=Hydrogenobacter hydrogenophilus TaxID=35835 RepID=A0A285NYV4_9AQUI|nr:twin-arginine translocase TatA/TatE family subunit [Hydrogenobacter hydrogenophilus]SNZ14655.1 sec-independent protein translocase protein TatB [Hydrogenobacter hydrogenophilus]